MALPSPPTAKGLKTTLDSPLDTRISSASRAPADGTTTMYYEQSQTRRRTCLGNVIKDQVTPYLHV